MFRTPSCSKRESVFDLIKDYPKEFLCPIDQFDSKDFNLNDAGWIRNDISQLARATSQSQYDAIMRRLVELKQEGGIPEGTKVEDAISMIKPRFAQSPNEIEDFIKMTNGDFTARLDEAYRKSLKLDDVNKSSLEPVPEPAPVSE